jgi:hypothetical protein
MSKRIGDVVELGETTMIALRGILTVLDTTELKPEWNGLAARSEPCTTIILEGGHKIKVTREDGALVRRYLTDYAREMAQAAARKSLL